MIIKAKEVDESMKQCYIYNPDKTVQKFFRVIAMSRIGHKWSYMIINAYNWVEWRDEDLCEFIDEKLPEDWVAVRYKRFEKIKNKNYDFDIKMSEYYGPKEFLENKNFLFDIYENNYYAYDVCYDYLKRKNYKLIKDVISAWDPIELISIHDFPEEHDKIIGKLSENLIRNFDVESIAKKIRDLYVDEFGLSGFGKRIEECKEIASKILLLA